MKGRPCSSRGLVESVILIQWIPLGFLRQVVSWRDVMVWMVESGMGVGEGKIREWTGSMGWTGREVGVLALLLVFCEDFERFPL